MYMCICMRVRFSENDYIIITIAAYTNMVSQYSILVSFRRYMLLYDINRSVDHTKYEMTSYIWVFENATGSFRYRHIVNI